MSDNRIIEICEELFELHTLCPEKSVFEIALELCDAYGIRRGYATMITAKFNSIEW